MTDQKRVFPIQSNTACLLKWAWSTIYLGQGKSASCHRTDQYIIPPDNLASFHNLPEKIQARKLMLKGEWPQGGCQYCEKIETAGGMSDRLYQIESGHAVTPAELLSDPTALEVVPTILEIYFNNTCNMSCLYCGNHFSSKWEEEDRRFGEFKSKHYSFGKVKPKNLNYDDMLEQFWQYLHDNDRYKQIRQFQVAGGEPFFQPELEACLDFWDTHPNPNVTFNFITNLKVPPAKLQRTMERLGRMVEEKKILGVQISSSLDAWGAEQEYVRWGLDLKEWQTNFEYIMTLPWVTQCINSAISALTVKRTQDLVERWRDWNNERNEDTQIHYSFMTTTWPLVLDPAIFGAGVFDQDFADIIAAMPERTHHERSAREHMIGIAKQVANTPRDTDKIQGLIAYLYEIDRRRGTNWRELFPWLNQEWK